MDDQGTRYLPSLPVRTIQTSRTTPLPARTAAVPTAEVSTPLGPPRRDARRSRSPRDRTYAEVLKDNGTSPGTNIWDNMETAMENNSASSQDPASLEAEVIFSPTPQYSDSGETPAETPAHDCGNDAAARENSGETNKEDTAHSVNTRSRSRSALLTAAHSEGQTQIPDTWRLEKEREESQPKRNGQNQQPDDEAATADSRA